MDVHMGTWVRLTIAGALVCGVLSCSESGDDNGTGPSGPSGPVAPTESELAGQWYGLDYTVDLEYAAADTWDITDSSYLIEATSNALIWVEVDESGACFCADTSTYTGLSGDTLLGDEMTGVWVSGGVNWAWSTTHEMVGNQLVITYAMHSSGLVSFGGLSYSSDTVYRSITVSEPYESEIPPSGLGECLDCDAIWKRKSAPGVVPSLRKGAAATDVAGTWRIVQWIEDYAISSHAELSSDTVVALRFSADSAMLYELSIDLAPTCHFQQRDTLGLEDTLLLGDAFTGSMVQGGESADWWTSLKLAGDTLKLYSEATGSTVYAETGYHGMESATATRSANLLSTVDDIPPASWPTTVCPYSWWEAW